MQQRQLASLLHDDGRQSWRMTRFAPPARLAGLVDAYVDYDERTDFTRRRELPHPAATMIVNLGAPISLLAADGSRLAVAAGQGFVAGAHLAPALSCSGGSQAGLQVMLPLAGMRRLAGMPMTELAGRIVPFDQIPPLRGLAQRLLAARDCPARVELLDNALAQAFTAAPPLPCGVAHALHLLRRHPARDIAAIATDIGWSRKHLAAQVTRAIGIGPRSWRRLLQFHRLVRSADTHGTAPAWADLAAGAGYTDQSHMIRVFREFAGLTPLEWFARLNPDGGGVVDG